MNRAAIGLMIFSALGLFAAQASAQNQSGTDNQPLSRPATRTARAPIPTVPRDKLPFTNEGMTDLNPELPTLFITGDSTAATGNPVTRGWAAVLVDYFDPSKVNLVNQAQGGARFNSYMDQRWDRVIAAVKPGDFVVIQFGQNSGPLPGIGEETQQIAGRNGTPTTMHSHGWYLRKFISDVRDKKATPIVMTLTVRDVWTNGKVERLKEQAPGQGGMSDWSRQVAIEEKALFVDHSNIIADIYDQMGQEKADALFGDHHLHTNTTGAIINCEAFISGLKAIPNMPLVDDLNDKGKAVPAYQPAGK